MIKSLSIARIAFVIAAIINFSAILVIIILANGMLHQSPSFASVFVSAQTNTSTEMSTTSIPSTTTATETSTTTSSSTTSSTTTSSSTTTTATSTTTSTTTTTTAAPAPKTNTSEHSDTHSASPTENETISVQKSPTSSNSTSKSETDNQTVSASAETESRSVTNESSLSDTDEATRTQNETLSKSYEETLTGNTSTETKSKTDELTETFHKNSTTLEATESQELTISNNTPSESQSFSETASLSNTTEQTKSQEGTVTNNETLSPSTSQTASRASPSASDSDTQQDTNTSELTQSASLSNSDKSKSSSFSHEVTESSSVSASQNSKTFSASHEETPSKSNSETRFTATLSESKEPTLTHEATHSASLSETTWSLVRVVNSIPLPAISALGLPVTPVAPLLEIEGSPQLQVDKEEWIPARKLWPLEFNLPKSQQTRGCRASVVGAQVLASSSSSSASNNIFPSESSCPVTSSSSVDASFFRVISRTSKVSAAFGQCSFDSLTIDWRSDIVNCLSNSASLNSNYRNPTVNITVRLCANVSGLSSRQQPLPRQEEICADTWTVMSSCPISRENLLYTMDHSFVRLADNNNNNNNNGITWNIEGTWFQPPERSQHDCRFTDNSGEEVFREPVAEWIDLCHVRCSLNASRINQLQQEVTVRSASNFINDVTKFKIDDSITVPGFSGYLSIVRDDYLFLSSCPGLSVETVERLDFDTTQSAGSQPSCQSLISDVKNRVSPLNSYRSSSSSSNNNNNNNNNAVRRNGCPIRLVGKPITPTFWPPSGQILAPVVLAGSNNNNNNNENEVLAVLQGTVEVAFCDLAGNRAFVSDASIGPKSLSSVSIFGQTSSSSSFKNESAFGTQLDFTNSTFSPLQIRDFVFPSSADNSSRCPDVEDIPLLFEPKEYFGWTNFSATISTLLTTATTSSSSPSSTTATPTDNSNLTSTTFTTTTQLTATAPPNTNDNNNNNNNMKFTPLLTYCVKYDADIPTDLQILNEGSILTAGDTDVGMPVAPIVSATNRIGKIISGNVERFRLKLRAEILMASSSAAGGYAPFSGFIFDQDVREFPVTVPVRFNATGTGYGVRISLWSSANGNQSSSSLVVFGDQYPAQKNITVRFCPLNPGNPPPFVDRIVAQYNNRNLCGNATSSKTLTDAIYQNETNTTSVLVQAGSVSYTDPVSCHFSNVDDPWSFSSAGTPAHVVSSCEVICTIPPQRFPIRALSAFAFNASGSWVSARTLASPPGMMRLKVGSAWIGPVSMDVYGRGASIVLLSFPQTIYIRLQRTILQPITVTIADAATNVLTGNDVVQRTVSLSSDEGTAVLLNGTNQLFGNAQTCEPPTSRNAIATLSNILFINAQAGEYTLRVASQGLSPLSVQVTLRNPDPTFRHYLRFGGKVPPLDFTDPSTDGTNFGKFPIPLRLEACIRGTQVPDSEVSGFSIIVRVLPVNPGPDDPLIDNSRGIGLTNCDAPFGNCVVSERGVAVFDQFRFFGVAGKKYRLTISMSNASLDVLPLYFTVHTPDCDVSTPRIVTPNRMRLLHSGERSPSIEVHAKYFPIPSIAFSGWIPSNESSEDGSNDDNNNNNNNLPLLSDDRYKCRFAGSTFPARFIDTCTIRCFVDDFLFFARRRLVNGSDSSSAATAPSTTTSDLSGDAKIENSSWMIGAANMSLPENISLCANNTSENNDQQTSSQLCCYDSQLSTIRCNRPTNGLLEVVIPGKFFTGSSTRNLRAVEGGKGTFYVIGEAQSAVVSQPEISSQFKLFERDQIVPVNPRTAQVKVASFDLNIVDSDGQALLEFDEQPHHVMLKTIYRRGVPVLSLPANWSSVLESTVPSPFVRQNYPGNCLEKIPGAIDLYQGRSSREAKNIYMNPNTNNNDNSSSFSTSTAFETTIESTETADNNNNNDQNTPSHHLHQGQVPIVQNITGIRTDGWTTANGSLRIQDLIFNRPSAGTYDITFSIEINAGTFVDASFSLHVVGGEPVDTCLWTFGADGLRNPLDSIVAPQPMFMFLDAAGNIYQPLRQNPNLTSHLGLIDESFVRNVKQLPFLLYRSKLATAAMDSSSSSSLSQYYRFTLQNLTTAEYIDNHGFTTTTTTMTTQFFTNTTTTPTTAASSNDNNNDGEEINQENKYAKSAVEFASRLRNLSNEELAELAQSQKSGISFEVPELEFIEPQGIGLLTFMFRSLRITSNFSYDFKVDFFTTSRLPFPEYWKNHNSTILSTPVFESEDCAVTDYALPETAECRSCPSGAKSCMGSIFPFCFICNGTTTSLVQNSYWRFSPESTVAYFCSRSTCLGPSVLGTCDERSIPMSPKCQVCAPGFSKALDGGCADCGEQWVSVVIVVVTVVIVAIVVAALVTASLRAHEASSSSSVVLLSKIFVNFLQVLGMLGEFGVGFPGFVKATLMGVSIGSGAAGLGLNPIYCLFPEFTFFHVLVLHLVLPVIVLLILASVLLLRGWLVSRRYRKREEARRRRQEQIAKALEREKTVMLDVGETGFVNINDDDNDNSSGRNSNDLMYHPKDQHILFESNGSGGVDAMIIGEGEEMKTRNVFSPRHDENNDDDDQNREEARKKSPSAEAAATENSSKDRNSDDILQRDLLSPEPERPIAASDENNNNHDDNNNNEKEQKQDSKTTDADDNNKQQSSFFQKFKGVFSLKKKQKTGDVDDENNNNNDDTASSISSFIDEEDDGELGPPPEMFQGRIFLTCAIIIMFLLYQSILTQTIETFRCEELDTTDDRPKISYMMADPRVPCVGRGYEEIISIAAWGLFLFGTFVPLLSLIAILWTARTQGWSQANDVFAFLINGFRLECWYWELVIVFRKVVIRVLLAVIEDDMLQALLGVWFLTAMFIIHAYRAPYVRSLHNNAESLSLLTTIMVLNFGMLLQRTQEMTQEICGLTCNILSLVLVIVLGIIVFFFAANIVRAFYDHLIEVLGVDRPDGRKVIVWRNVKRAVGSALGRDDKLPTNFTDYTPAVLEPHIAEMLGTDLGSQPRPSNK